jgi:predicted RNase H-like nuclease (RuvC/YqgF family)
MTHDTEDASLARLEEQVARLSRRIEIDIVAELASPAEETLSGDVGQRPSSQKRRKRSVVEELAQQVQLLTDSLAEQEEAMEDLKQRSESFARRLLPSRSHCPMLT